MPTTAYDLSNVAYRGLINEDVMQEIFRIDPVDLPYMDMAGTAKSDNPYKEWVQENLGAVSIPTAVIDGSDAPAAGTFSEARIGNHHEINVRRIQVSDRAREVDAIGYSDRLIHELMIRQKEMKRNMEAGLLSNKASVGMTNALAGQYAGCGAMFAKSVSTAPAPNVINGTVGTFSAGIFSVPTPGAARALTESDVRLGMSMAYKAGGNPTILMSVPEVVEKFSSYLFTASARIATLMTQNDPVRQGKYEKQGIRAVGAVNTFVTDFGTLELVPNRSQTQYTVGGTTTVANVYLFDPDYWEVSYLQNVQASEVARTGLAENRMLSVDYTNVAKQALSSAVIMGINSTLAVTL